MAIATGPVIVGPGGVWWRFGGGSGGSGIHPGGGPPVSDTFFAHQKGLTRSSASGRCVVVEEVAVAEGVEEVEGVRQILVCCDMNFPILC